MSPDTRYCSPIDLHCHSTASDGALTPAAVVVRAAAQGVRVLALTDHDTVDGIDEAARAATSHGVHLIPAAELSCQWQGRELHVVGLGIDPAAGSLREGLARVRELRKARLKEILRKLARAGIDDLGNDPRDLAGGGMPTRMHIARALVGAGHVSSLQRAFDRYLRRGRPAWVRPRWPEMREVITLIRRGGGRAVLAHPLAYGMTGAWLRRTLEAFRDAGGEGVEVVCGNTDRQRISTATGQALRAGLLGSVGSDFHDPDNPWIELGRLQRLPSSVTPVWRHWPEVAERMEAAAH
jgi:3',5'-nucleoside bisphosphate phosphatase